MNQLPKVLQNEIWEHVRGDRAFWKQKFNKIIYFAFELGCLIRVRLVNENLDVRLTTKCPRQTGGELRFRVYARMSNPVGTSIYVEFDGDFGDDMTRDEANVHFDRVVEYARGGALDSIDPYAYVEWHQPCRDPRPKSKPSCWSRLRSKLCGQKSSHL